MMDLERYKSIPYKEHGRDFSGVDCWGLARLIRYHESGILMPSWSAEYETSNKAPYSELIGKEHCLAKWRQLERPQVLAVALFEIAGFFHVGTVLDRRGREMIHILKDTSVTIEPLRSIEWRDRFRGWWLYGE
ncbi:MAG: NlpC/P60 family protein [Desulforhopalus sp.]